MGATTNISWTDATVNFWWGCTKVGPGCDHCYAETWSKRTGETLWGKNSTRRKIKGAVALLHRLDNDYSEWSADAHCGQLGPDASPTRRVFISSMSDLFDTDVPLEWFDEAWTTIERCDRVHIQICTKRLPNIRKRLVAIGRTSWPKHVGLLATMVDQDEADRDAPRLLALKSELSIPWVGVSAEPLLGAIDFRVYMPNALWNDLPSWKQPELDWIIVAGESGGNARSAPASWRRAIRDQCAAAGVAFFHKQWGEWIDADEWLRSIEGGGAFFTHLGRRLTAPLNYDDARVVAKTGGFRFEHQSDGSTMIRVGKVRAGDLLDGVRHHAFPEALQ